MGMMRPAVAQPLLAQKPDPPTRMAHGHHVSIPHWSWITPALAGMLLAAVFASALSGGAGSVSVLAALLLGATIFASVHHAEVLAVRVGEPFGSIVLAVAVTVIEVALIVSIMLSDAGGTAVVARDTVFSAVMIVLNGVIGACLVLGGRRHYAQVFQIEAASAALAVLGTLAILTLVLPSVLAAGGEREFAPVQAAVVGLVSLALYAVFVVVQTVRHRDFFLDLGDSDDGADEPPPSTRITLVCVFLFLLLFFVVFL